VFALFPALAAALAFLAWSVRGRAAAVFAPSVWRAPSGRRALALTFDDGPSEGTPELLRILAEHGVSATFFFCGANVERLPEVARAVADAGHEIGNHSHTHPLFCFRSADFMENELRRAQETIRRQTGISPALFRPPFGARWFGLGRAQRRLGLQGVMWSVIGYDWKQKADRIVRRVAARVSDGAIVCLHDGRELRPAPDTGATAEAVRRLVPMLLEQGYTFETVTRLICPKN
jgi:peptidoglycan-N-acetylglucosamine deacetylase